VLADLMVLRVGFGHCDALASVDEIQKD
jgi:hypothetical protein